ncbi:MAG: glycosyltransferase family 4 protein, partial [Bdellovibrionales bacterium]|nr:glycosyltransferase family 4 protein [Bdellovibrionales bacterium]
HVKLKIVGSPDEPGIMEYLKNEVDKHHLWDRVEFLGRVDDQSLIELFSKAIGVYYAPHNEDYGYVTLEALASGRPVVTAYDSGGVLEFIEDGTTGLIVEPQSDAIGHAFNRLIDQPSDAQKMGERGRAFIEDSGLAIQGWDRVLDGLLSPLRS